MRIMQFAQDMVIGLPIEAGARVSEIIRCGISGLTVVGNASDVS